MNREARVTVEGVLERVVSQGEDDGFTVARLQLPGRSDLVTIVGNILSANPGETLRLRGKWVVNVKFGEQFQVESCLSLLPATLTGIEKYLGSGMVKEIGPVMAGGLVARFRVDTLGVIEEDPHRLQKVEGIDPVRAGRIVKAREEQKKIREVMVFLQGHGVRRYLGDRIQNGGQNREEPWDRPELSDESRGGASVHA